MKHENVVISNELIKIELHPWKIWKAYVSNVRPSPERKEESKDGGANLNWGAGGLTSERRRRQRVGGLAESFPRKSSEMLLSLLNFLLFA